MTITRSTVYKIIFAILFLIAIYLIYKMFTNNSEHLDPALLTHQVQDLSFVTGDNLPLKFYYKGEDTQPHDYLPHTTGFNCAGKNSYDFTMTPGADGYGDQLWGKVSPSNILSSNCLTCQKGDNYPGPSPALEDTNNDQPKGFDNAESSYDTWQN